MNLLTHEQSLVSIKMHYISEINREMRDLEFRRSLGILPNEESVSKTNEKLYQLFMFRNNIDNILERETEYDS